MATRDGSQAYDWLLKHGWKPAPIDPEIFGDPTVIDPVTGKELDIYTAIDEHKQRTGESPEFLEK